MLVKKIFKKGVPRKWYIVGEGENNEIITFRINGKNLINLMSEFNTLNPKDLENKNISRVYKNGKISFTI